MFDSPSIAWPAKGEKVRLFLDYVSLSEPISSRTRTLVMSSKIEQLRGVNASSG